MWEKEKNGREKIWKIVQEEWKLKLEREWREKRKREERQCLEKEVRQKKN